MGWAVAVAVAVAIAVAIARQAAGVTVSRPPEKQSDVEEAAAVGGWFQRQARDIVTNWAAGSGGEKHLGHLGVGPRGVVCDRVRDRRGRRRALTPRFSGRASLQG